MNLYIKCLTLYPWGRLGTVLLLLGVTSIGAWGQDSPKWSIEDLQQKAVANYPMARQYGLIELSRDYTLSNASKGYLPQLGLNARATYQSDVTQLPTAMPGVKPMNKDQYQAVLELNQVIWDGGSIEAQKKLAKATSDTELKRNEAELYTVRERVNQLFFGTLLIEEQLRQSDILISELNNNFKKISAFVDNGIATKSDLDVVRVEILKVGQRREELKMTSSTYREMLASLTGLEEVKEGDLIKPRVDLNALTGKINRPELGLFEAQMRLLTSQESGIKASTMPRLNLFLQGGYGNPGLNMLKNEFSTFYIGGVRLVWNFGSLYTRGNSLKKLESGRESIRVQRETFLFNNNLAENQQRNEVEKLAKQLASDDEIIAIRERIKKAAEKKVEEGTISVSDLVREINAESMARQERSTHEIMHLMAIYSIKYLKNN
ncbi:MAG: TolC family protein [Bacteroidales bacterium]|nr:TolC family protein [Bacteroidales bacterium]